MLAAFCHSLSSESSLGGPTIAKASTCCPGNKYLKKQNKYIIFWTEIRTSRIQTYAKNIPRTNQITKDLKLHTLSYKFSRGFFFAKQTRYGVKQKSNGLKMNENFMRKRKVVFREDLFSWIKAFQIFREDLISQ